jgi:mono/diheme cytochrome c family protein
MSQTESPPAETTKVPPDPLVHKSYSVPIAISMAAVVAATALAVADEFWLRRPYKEIQSEYAETYPAYLEKVEAKRRAFYDDVFQHVDEFQKLKAAADAAKASCAVPGDVAQAALDTATAQSRALGEALKDPKARIAALTYESEHKAHEAGHLKVADSPEAKPIVDEIEGVQGQSVTYTWKTRNVEIATDEQGVPHAKVTDGEQTETGKVGDLLVKAAALEVDKANLQKALGDAMKPAAEASKAQENWLADHAGDLQYALQNCDDATRARIVASGAAGYLDREAVVLKPDVIEGLRQTVLDNYASGWTSYFDHDHGIDQIHIAEANNWVDRCVTCHLNVREPLSVTVDGLKRTLAETVTVPAATPDGQPTKIEGWPKAKIDSMPLELFVSHPNPALLKTHDPERFGCSMCHNGNGVAITSVELAHGTNHDWLMPVFPKANIEAGCVQCHEKDLVLPSADRLNAGRDRFRRAGCWGCHKYEGFGKELDEITALNGRRKDVDEAIATKQMRNENLRLLVGQIDDDAAKAKEQPVSQAERDALVQQVALLTTEKADIEKRLRAVFVERQRVGPNLKDVRIKIRPEFLTDWIRSPRDAHKDSGGHAFRPDTKMPTFRWWGDPDEEVKDVAAFIWQSALDPAKFHEMQLPKPKSGDAKRGQELFEKTGCLACHSIGTGEAQIGNDYAANLSNLAEKDTPEYVARWITHPRERLVAYDPSKAPGERDVAGAKPPEGERIDGDPNLVWAQHAIMPNFRLSEQEVADITAYLMSQKRADVKYEEPTWLADKGRFERGKKLVLYQGCAGCHEISGLEDEKGIGTELTTEGNKPVDRLDFGHHTIEAERGEEPLKDGAGLLEDAASLFKDDASWYRQRGFVMHKIAKPDVYDDSKYLPDRFNRLRMPQFKFTAQEITDVTTMILGSVESKIPESFRYRPGERGKAIQEGWWIVKKYNCQGCHQVEPTDVPSLWKVPFFAEKCDPKSRDQFLPPSLVGVGFRLRPEWMAKFLRDPSLGGGRERPKATRAHLPVRMPTFDFSDDEIRKLVLFFEAMADQPSVYQPEVLKPLTDPEQKAAAAIWKSANCIQCHVVDGSEVTSETKAPNLSYAPQRLRPEWMRRWISNPPAMNPNTAMTKSFGEGPGADGKWHFMTPLPELQGVDADNVDLMVRYVSEGKAAK